MSTFARLGVFAVGRPAYDRISTNTARIEAEGTYALSLSRSTMGMARDGETAIRATKSLKRADLDGMLQEGVRDEEKRLRRCTGKENG